jgi:hypothetical protein
MMSHPFVEAALAEARERLSPAREGGAWFLAILEKFATSHFELDGLEAHVAAWIARAATWAAEAIEVPAAAAGR